MIRHFSKEHIQMTNELIERYLASLIREMQVKIAMRYHTTSVRMAIIKKKATSVIEDMEKPEALYIVGGN